MSEKHEEYDVDVFKYLHVMAEAMINKAMLDIIESAGDETIVAIFKLLNEYGISGSKAIEFLTKLDVLMKTFNNKDDEGVGEN